MNFKDHFSGHATLYRDARPAPPPDWFAWLADQVPDHELAWDAGCGNGQASVALAAYFAHVVGTDPSAAQVGNAQPHPRVEYRVEPAEHATLPPRGVSLVCVSQALHWFDAAAFFDEVKRVARPGSLLAVSAYANCSVTAGVDAVEHGLYADTLGADWPPERARVDAGYRDLAFPFAAIATPTFTMAADWTLDQYLAYLRSWSATQRHIKAHGGDPVADAEPALRLAWGDREQLRRVRWPFITRVCRVD